jgi:hypothetical protein
MSVATKIRFSNALNDLYREILQEDERMTTKTSADVPLSLVQRRVNSNRREVALAQQSVELLCTVDRLDEDADL